MPTKKEEGGDKINGASGRLIQEESNQALVFGFEGGFWKGQEKRGGMRLSLEVSKEYMSP